MRIVALHTDFRIYWPARWKALATELKKNGHELYVVEIAGKGSPYSFASQQDEDDSLNWHILFPHDSPEQLSGKTIEQRLFPLLKSISPQVIIAGAIAFPSGALAVKWGMRHGTRIIIFDDAKWSSVRRSRLVNFIKKSVYAGADALFLPAYPWEQTGKFWGFDHQQLFYGVDVVDNGFWATPDNTPSEYGDYLIAVGRQIPVKNFSTLLKAYSQYCSNYYGQRAYRLVLVGDGPMRQELEKFISDHELAKMVILLPFKTQFELRSLFQRARALCLPSYSETWGLVINEAMAAGCAIIASNECGASEVLVKDGVNGFTFPSDNVEALAACLDKFHKLDRKEFDGMRNASKNIIADWGVARFVTGALDAIGYVYSHPKRSCSLLQKFIITHWRGQYRPV
ncbi:MAG: glycosyltransferase family 4 protein [Muribaculaceae bacterium]|nr:glycosyltransferase family 4 protein [Muribaculaceae bacterium]